MEKYLSDVIGEEYKDWKPGQVIFLSAHTGAGKTYFILNKLVKFAAIEKKKILYLANRSILKKQIEEQINGKVMSFLRSDPEVPNENLQNIINIKLYQTLEKECQRSNDYIENFQKYDYIIADECHYFLEDSIFNTDTKFSYDWIFHRKSHTVLIFISATIERIKEYVIQDQKLPVEKSVEERKKGPRVCRGDLDINDIVRTYNIEPDYSYLNLELLKNTQEIVEYVQKESKWLIFVDSIKRGKEIKSLLDKSL